ncbi:MAG: DUF998 domain-containing protein [Nitriliruptorales bacterium]
MRVGPYAAIAAVAQFVTTWAVLGATRDGYEPMSQAISELAEMGSPTRVPMTASLILFGLLLAPFVTTLRRALPGGGAAAAAVLLNAVGSIGVGAFSCTPGCPGPEASPSDFAHVVAASISYLGLILAPLVTAWCLRRVDDRPGLWRFSVMLGLLTLVGVTAWAGGLAGEAGGVLQRFATTTGDVWYVIAAIALLQRGGKLERAHIRLAEPEGKRLGPSG